MAVSIYVHTSSGKWNEENAGCQTRKKIDVQTSIQCMCVSVCMEAEWIRNKRVHVYVVGYNGKRSGEENPQAKLMKKQFYN